MPVLAAVQSLDEAILHAARGTPAFAVPLFFALTVIGGGWGLLGAVPFALRRETRAAAIGLVIAVAFASLGASIVKALVGRVRPCDALGWCAPLVIGSPGGPSFPSGHAAGSFAFATYLAVRAPRFAVPVLAIAALIAWSRCVLGVHYPSDVLGGAILGGTIGTAMARLAEVRERRALVTASAHSETRSPEPPRSGVGDTETPG